MEREEGKRWSVVVVLGGCSHQGAVGVDCYWDLNRKQIRAGGQGRGRSED